MSQELLRLQKESKSPFLGGDSRGPSQRESGDFLQGLQRFPRWVGSFRKQPSDTCAWVGNVTASVATAEVQSGAKEILPEVKRPEVPQLPHGFLRCRGTVQGHQEGRSRKRSLCLAVGTAEVL